MTAAAQGREVVQQVPRQVKSNPEDHQPQLSVSGAIDAGMAFKALSSLAHGAIGVLLLVILAFGVMFVVQGKEKERLLVSLAQSQQQILQLQVENDRLTELVAPVKKKIERGGAYIHKTYKVPVELANYYAEEYMKGSLRTGINYSVALSIGAQESGFNADAVSDNGCCLGLNQLHARYRMAEYPGLRREDLFDPAINIDLAYNTLDNYSRESGSLYGGILRYRGSEEPGVNEAYAAQVMDRAHRISRYITGLG